MEPRTKRFSTSLAHSFLLTLPLLASITFCPNLAFAQPTAADKQTARALLIEGRLLLESGDARTALAKFQAAHALMGVPTTGLDVAKALEALGQLVEARAMAYEVTQIPAPPNETAAFHDARESAAQAMESLDSRIPSLLVRLEGAPREGVVVTVDGEKIQKAALGIALARNPGKHDIVVKAPGYQTEQTTVELKEGVLAAVDVPVLLRKEEITEKDAPVKADGGSKKGILYAGIGVAGGLALVGVGTAVGTFAIYGPAQDKLDGKCESNCETEFNALVSTQQKLAYTSLFTFIGAGVIGGATLAYALSGKKTKDTGMAAQTAVVVVPAPGGVVVVGRW